MHVGQCLDRVSLPWDRSVKNSCRQRRYSWTTHAARVCVCVCVCLSGADGVFQLNFDRLHWRRDAETYVNTSHIASVISYSTYFVFCRGVKFCSQYFRLSVCLLISTITCPNFTIFYTCHLWPWLWQCNALYTSGFCGWRHALT